MTMHAIQRCDERVISLEEVKQVIATGEILQSYPQDRPYPSYLVMGRVRGNEPLYVLCAVGAQLVHIITVHWLDPHKWLDPKTRREKNT
ncbi:MAG: DUF4258 domain-containing protein [Elusimicrobia bacterium]|nr:DUF4258 domain-containing protein [Elusimicrobiota bacterium]